MIPIIAVGLSRKVEADSHFRSISGAINSRLYKWPFYIHLLWEWLEGHFHTDEYFFIKYHYLRYHLK